MRIVFWLKKLAEKDGGKIGERNCKEGLSSYVKLTSSGFLDSSQISATGKQDNTIK